jgi:hypothetical protein
MIDHSLMVLAFIARFAALLPLILLYRFFAAVDGPTVDAFRRLFGSWIVLLLWVTAASVGELLAFIPLAGTAVERGAAYIFIPNLIVAIPLWHLWYRLRVDAAAREAARPEDSPTTPTESA